MFLLIAVALFAFFVLQLVDLVVSEPTHKTVRGSILVLTLIAIFMIVLKGHVG